MIAGRDLFTKNLLFQAREPLNQSGINTNGILLFHVAEIRW